MLRHGVVFTCLFILMRYIISEQRVSLISLRPRSIATQATHLHDPLSLCPEKLSLNRLAMLQIKWGSYRLTDAIKGYYFRVSKFHPVRKSFSYIFNLYSLKFGPTLVTDYFSMTNSSKLNSTLFFQILQPKFLELPYDTAVVHLRLGDTTCLECWNNRTTYGKSGKVYVYPRTYYEHVLRLLNRTNVTKLILTSSTYFRGTDRYMKFSARTKNVNETYTTSMKYVNQIDNFFMRHGYQVSHNINCGLPDEDFIFMASSKYFVPGGGGFSRLIGNMVKMNSGHVLEGRK